MAASARFPQLKVSCSWCSSPAGELCTNPATGAVRRSATHDVRRIDWVTETTTCPVCAAAPGSACFATPTLRPPLTAQRVPLDSPHPERITAADRAHTLTHRTQPWPHQPPTAPTATARSTGPAPRPAAVSPSIPSQIPSGMQRSGATAPALFGPAARPPTSR